MAHYINDKKVASSPAAIPDNVVFRGGYESEIGKEETFAIDKAHALTSSAGNNRLPVYFNNEGKPVAIDFVPASGDDIEGIVSGDTVVGDSAKLGGKEASKYAEKEFVAQAIADVDHLKRQIVTGIPTAETAKENVIYMYKDPSATGSDKYKEYQLIDGEVVLIGDTSVDLSDYAKIEKIEDGSIVAGDAAKLGGTPANDIKSQLAEKIESEPALDFDEARKPDFQVTVDTVMEEVAGVKSDLSENDKTTSFIQKELNLYEITEQDGYLKANLQYGGLDKFRSKTTKEIPCSEGDTFSYYGIGEMDTISWAFLNNGVLVSTGQNPVDENKQIVETTVVIPSGVTHVIFSSYSAKEQGYTVLLEDTVLVVKYKGNDIFENIHSEIGSIYKDTGFIKEIYKNDGYLTEVGLFENTEQYYSLTTDKLPCKSGDVFVYTGVGFANAYSYLFYNGNNIVSGGQNNATLAKPTTIEVVIPDGVNYVKFASFNAKDKGITLSVYLKGSLKDELMQTNALHGKKYIACGDSFTAGDFSNSQTNDYTFGDGLYGGCKKVYPYYIGRRNNMIVVNEAVNGSTITNITGRNPFSADRLLAIPEDADYITLKFGINDAYQNATLGTIDDTENTTFFGAWNVVLDYLITNFPYTKIGVIVSNSIPNIDYVEATKQVCKKWGIPYLDMATGEDIPLMLGSKRTDVTAKAKTIRNQMFSVLYGTNDHPNEKAHEFESTIVEAFLRRL